MKWTRRGMLHWMGVGLLGCAVKAPGAQFSKPPGRAEARRLLNSFSEEISELRVRFAEGAFHVAEIMQSEAASEGSLEARLELVARELERANEREGELFLEAERLLEYHEALVSPRRAMLWQLGALGHRLSEDEESVKLERELLEAQLHGLGSSGVLVSWEKLNQLKVSDHPSEREQAAQALLACQHHAAPVAVALFKRRGLCAQGLGESYVDLQLRLQHVSSRELDRLVGEALSRTERMQRELLQSLTRVSRSRSLQRHELEYWMQRASPLYAGAFSEERVASRVNGAFEALGVEPLRIDWLGEQPEGASAYNALLSRVNGSVRRRLNSAMNVSLDERGWFFFGESSRRMRAAGRAPSGYGRLGWIYGLLARELAKRSALGQEPLFIGNIGALGQGEPSLAFATGLVLRAALDEQPGAEHWGRLRERQRAQHLRSIRQNSLWKFRGRVARLAFEREALLRPEQDLERLMAGFERRFLGLPAPAARQSTFWATSPELVWAPLGSASLLLGQLMASQLQATLRRLVQARAAASDWEPGLFELNALRAPLSSGMATSSREKLIAFTGAPLSVGYWVEGLRAGFKQAEAPPKILKLPL